tara:strand:+ start:1020 stop:1169 length:150 start_codon:yes stop_codon:yes gene_type:complete
LNNFLKVYLLWLTGVIGWNFGFPSAKPLADIFAAVILSLVSYQLNRAIK